MAAVSIRQMRALESQAFTNGWTEEQLMNLAGERLGRALAFHYPHPGTAIAYLGKGHNAADALIALKILRDDYQWNVRYRTAYPKAEMSLLAAKKLDELGGNHALEAKPSWRDQKPPLLLLDGLLGIGASGPIRSPLMELADEIHSLRTQAGAYVASVDIPSGVDADTGSILPHAVTADSTWMVGAAKQGLLLALAAAATGKLALVPVEPLTDPTYGPHELICPQNCDFGKSPRSFDFHKGQAGRISIVAGSENYQGAAVMAATGALRAGGGLITLFVPLAVRDSIGRKCPAEIMVRGYENPLEALELPHHALVIGCGLGELSGPAQEPWIQLISNMESPAVLDADALNLLARVEGLSLLKKHHVITPHPGEFRRLAPHLHPHNREATARSFVENHPAILLLKGSRTLVSAKNHPLWINSTGSPGMATGGQGDLLSGVIGALMAGGLEPMQAASLAAWICGRAAERALLHPEISEESLTPSDVANHLGGAFKDWKTSSR